MHTARCEWCGKTVQFKTYKWNRPEGWSHTGKSRWGKRYDKRGGYGWWCPEHRTMLAFHHLPEPAQRALGKYIGDNGGSTD